MKKKLSGSLTKDQAKKLKASKPVKIKQIVKK